MAIYLVDKSAWEWARRDAVASAELTSLVDAGDILAGSHMTALEIAYSAKNQKEHAKVIANQRTTMWLPVTEAVMDRAIEVAELLAPRGQHRTPIPDLIIAATAELHGTTVLHVDSDYLRIAALTGQPQRRLSTTPGAATP